MILRLLTFLLGAAAVVVVPGAGLGLVLFHKVVKPLVERRRRLKETVERARYLAAISSPTCQQCSICLLVVDLNKDRCQYPYGSFHQACMDKLMKGESK